MLSQAQIFTLVTAMMVLSGQTLAAPKRVCTARKSVTANFENENYVLGTVTPALKRGLVSLTDVGTHGSLIYHGFSGINNALGQGVLPHSAPNEIVTGLPESLLDGTAYITANTPNTTYFDLKGFYFGCGLDTATGLLGVPAPCTITATGYYQGKEQISQDFVYRPVLEPITLPTALPSGLPSAVISDLPSAISSVVSVLPSKLPSAVSSILSVAPTALPSAISSILSELPGDGTSIIGEAPSSVPGLISTVTSLVDSLPTALPAILPRALPFSAPEKKAKIAKAACHTGFMGVDKVTFTTTNGALVLLYLDDIQYVPHHCT